MSDVATPSAAAAAAGNSHGKLDSTGSLSSSIPSSSAALSEYTLQKQLKSALETLENRKPHPTYKKLLERNLLTRRIATIPKNEFYKRIGSRLRERVEVYTREMQGKDPFDRISQVRIAFLVNGTLHIDNFIERTIVRSNCIRLLTFLC